MRALVAGVGAIGGWMLARLTEGGADVTGWARGETYARLAAGEPLTLESAERPWSGPVRVVDRPDGPYDLVFVTTKSADTDEVGRQLPPGGIVVSVQNGVENADVLRRHHDRVVAAVVYSGCERVAPTTIVHRNAGFLRLDDGEVASWVEAHGIPVDVVDDIDVAQWQKLMGNVCANSLCAITRLPIDEAFGAGHLDDVALAAMREVAAVAAAEGVELDAGLPELVVAGMKAMPGTARPSTLQDLERGRPLERDALTGVIVRLGRAHSVPTPTVAALDGLLAAISP